MPNGDRPKRFLVAFAKAPHVGKGGIVLLLLILLAVGGAARTGRISFVAAGFLGFAGLTGTLLLLSLYDLVIDVLRLHYPPAVKSRIPEPFRIGSTVVTEYVRWLSPLGFVIGIIFGHYFWQ